MQIVIDISDERYKDIQRIAEVQLGLARFQTAEQIIAKGKPLPKGHGRLIDADELKKEYPHDTDWDYPVNTNSCVVESIDNSPTIIEANKEDE